jgi:hypothetical protein
MDCFMGISCISIDGPGPRGKILTCDARGPEFKSRVLCLLHFQGDILGSLGSNLVFTIPFGIM